MILTLVLLSLVSRIAAGETPTGWPVYFEPNGGQFPPHYRFAARGGGQTVLIAADEALFARDGTVRAKLAGARGDARAQASEPLPGTSNYFFGNDPARWVTRVSHYLRVQFDDIYPGVRLAYYARGGRLEQDFIVSPEADPGQIRIEFEGVDRIVADESGDLVLHTRSGSIRYGKPFLYQETESGRAEVAGAYRRLDATSVGFEIGTYDPSLALVIDPIIERASTTFGGAGDDVPLGVDSDAAGNVYVSGRTTSPSLGISGGLFSSSAGGVDGFVVKFDPSLRTPIFATYFGGSGDDLAWSVVVDSAGNALVGGGTASSNFPVRNAIQGTYGGGPRDAFLLKLSPDGSQLPFSTFVGGSGDDAGQRVVLDASGAPLLIGGTNSSNFATTVGALKTAPPSGYDSFVTKLASDGGSRIFSTLLGGSRMDIPTGIALSDAGDIFLSGFTSGDFPVTAGARQTTYGGGAYDAYLARIDATGRRLIYATYLGGGGDDRGGLLALAPDGTVWFNGFYSSTNFPFTIPAPALTGARRGFLARILPASSGSPGANDIAKDGNAAERATVPATPGSLIARDIGEGEIFTLNILPGRDPRRYSLSQWTVPLPNVSKLTYYDDNANILEEFTTSGEIGWSAVRGSISTVAYQFRFGTSVQTTIRLLDLPRAVPVTYWDTDFKGSIVTDDDVSAATGEMFDTKVFVSLGGVLPLRFAIHYSSLLASHGYSTALGVNRMHNFDVRLVLAGSRAAVLHFPGRIFNFVQGSGGTWQYAERKHREHQLVQAGGNLQFLERGPDLVYTFSPSGALLRIEDRNGNALTVTQGPNGPNEVSDGRGRVLRFVYSAGKLTRVQDQTGRSLELGYEGDLLASLTDLNGKRWSYAHTRAAARQGLLTAETRPNGNRPFVQTYDAQGRVIEQADGRGNKLRLAFDTPAAGVTTVTDAMGNPFRHTHGSAQNVTGIEDPSGAKIESGYDANNRRTSITDRAGDRSLYRWDAAGNLTGFTDTEGATTGLAWETQRQGAFTYYVLRGITYADGSSMSFARNERGNVTAVTDRAGKIWRLAYNAAGQLQQATLPTGGQATLAYNPDATLASVRLPSGDTWRIEYDDKKRPVRLIHPDNATLSGTWDNRGFPLRLTDERGKVAAFNWDDNGNLRSITDALDKTAAFTWDADDRTASATDRSGRTMRISRNAQGQVESVTNAAADTVRFTYDGKLRRVNSMADCAGNTWSFTHDPEGLVKSVTDPLGRRVQYERDKMGRITSYTTPAGERYAISYDALGRPVTASDPLGNSARYTWEPRGLASIALPAGITASYERNDLGRVSAITDPNGSVWRRSFDQQGRLIEAIDPLNRATRRTYDSRGRVASLTWPDNVTVTFTYDAAGNLIRCSYSDGLTINYTYDDANRLIGSDGLTLAYDSSGRVIESNGLRIGRDEAGRLASIEYEPGKVVTYKYDCRGLLTEVTDWVGGVTRLAYNAAGQLTAIERPNNTTTGYTYDQNGRVASISHGEAASVSLTRDNAGRVTSVERNLPTALSLEPAATDFAYDTAHQLTTAQYDARGRRVSDERRSYQWDSASRLTGTGGTRHGYDGLNQRISSGNRTFVLNYATPLPTVSAIREEGAGPRYYVWLPGGDLLHSIGGEGSRRFYHFDEGGSTALLTGDNGEVTDTYATAPLGEAVTRSGSTPNPYVWKGADGFMEEGDGLYYRNPWYQSANGSFLDTEKFNDGQAPPRPAVTSEIIGGVGTWGWSYYPGRGWINAGSPPPFTATKESESLSELETENMKPAWRRRWNDFEAGMRRKRVAIAIQELSNKWGSQPLVQRQGEGTFLGLSLHPLATDLIPMVDLADRVEEPSEPTVLSYFIDDEAPAVCPDPLTALISEVAGKALNDYATKYDVLFPGEFPWENGNCCRECRERRERKQPQGDPITVPMPLSGAGCGDFLGGAFGVGGLVLLDVGRRRRRAQRK